MTAEGASWSGYGNRLAIGVYFAYAGAAPTNAAPTVPILYEIWLRTNYSSYNLDGTASWSGAASGSATKRLTNSNAILIASGTFNMTASYDVEVSTSISATGNSSGSGPISHTAPVKIVRRPTANPSAPTNLKVTPSNGSTARITWTNATSWPGSSSGRSYVGQLATNSTFTALVASGTFTNGGSFTSLTPGQKYWARVRSAGAWWDATRYSGWVTTSFTMPKAPTVSAAPTATSVARTSFTVPTATVSDNGGAAPTDYRVQVNTSASATGATTLTKGSWAAVAVTGRAPLTTYYYRVAAYNLAGWGAYSAWKSVKTLDAVPNDPAAPTVSAITETGATVTWTAPALNGATLDGYVVVISATNDPGTPVKTYTVANDVLSQEVTGLTKAKDYQAFVRARATPTDSGFSDARAFRTAGVLATLYPTIVVGGVHKKLEIWTKIAGTWKRVMVELNVAGTWKRTD